jgi:hypothetical protein
MSPDVTRSLVHTFTEFMRDYWLSKLFFDLQTPAAAAAYRASRDTVLARYPLKPEVRAAIENNDVATLAPLVNAYLLRFYFLVSGMPEDEFLRRIRATTSPAKETSHG